MQPAKIACRHVQPDGWNCGAEAGEPCTQFDGVTRTPLDYFHLERITDASTAGKINAPINETTYDAVVEKAVDEMLG
jgi:hypothetical protein